MICLDCSFGLQQFAFLLHRMGSWLPWRWTVMSPWQIIYWEEVGGVAQWQETLRPHMLLHKIYLFSLRPNPIPIHSYSFVNPETLRQMIDHAVASILEELKQRTPLPGPCPTCQRLQKKIMVPWGTEYANPKCHPHPPPNKTIPECNLTKAFFRPQNQCGLEPCLVRFSWDSFWFFLIFAIYWKLQSCPAIPISLFLICFHFHDKRVTLPFWRSMLCLRKKIEDSQNLKSILSFSVILGVGEMKQIYNHWTDLAEALGSPALLLLMT